MTPSPLNPAQSPLLLAERDRQFVRPRGRSTRYARITFAAPEVPRSAERIPVNIALVLDRSGSMGGEKFVLARRAVEQALGRLCPEDRFSLVVYDNAIDVLAESALATAEAKRAALVRLAEVGPRGGTNLASGWLRGCEQVALWADGRAISRCLLLTDGLANDGITDRAELIRHAAALRERGVQTSTFGVGEDFDERLLAGMADAGGGHFYLISSAAQIPALIQSEVGEALEVVVRQAVLEVRVPSRVAAEPLTRLRSRVVASDDGAQIVRIELGDLVSGQDVEAIVTLRFPRGEIGERMAVEFSVVDGDGLPCALPASLEWVFASDTQNDTQPRNRAVDRPVATLYAARARAAAVEHNRAGHYDRARRELVETARRIRGYAGQDAELNRIADELATEQVEYAAPMPAMAMKQRYFAAEMANKDRVASGTAKRRAQ